MKWHQNDKGNHILFDDYDKMRGTVFPHALAEGWAVVIDNCFLKGLWKTLEEAQKAAERFAEEILTAALLLPVQRPSQPGSEPRRMVISTSAPRKVS